MRYQTREYTLLVHHDHDRRRVTGPSSGLDAE
jgi:hypothetical protein